jgi:hypothetical protein
MTWRVSLFTKPASRAMRARIISPGTLKTVWARTSPPVFIYSRSRFPRASPFPIPPVKFWFCGKNQRQKPIEPPRHQGHQERPKTRCLEVSTSSIFLSSFLVPLVPWWFNWFVSCFLAFFALQPSPLRNRLINKSRFLNVSQEDENEKASSFSDVGFFCGGG